MNTTKRTKTVVKQLFYFVAAHVNPCDKIHFLCKFEALGFALWW